MKKFSLSLLGATLVSSMLFAYTIVPYKSAWKYLDNGTDQGSSWSTNAFNDAAWG